MAISLRSLALGFRRWLLAPLIACGCAGAAHAVFIDFEDLPPIPGNEDLTGYPVTDQYAPLGVSFTSGAYLVHWIPNAYVLSDLDQQDLIFRFSGTLPTYVSFDLGALRPTDVRWRGATGRGENIRLDGHGPGDVSFSSQAGIALVKITFPFYVKGPGHVGFDNLYFGNVPAVPAPAPLVLGGVGLLTLLLAALRGRNDKTLSAKAAATGKAWRRIAAALLLGLGGAAAHATLITFDDLAPPSDPLEPASTPVSDEYASLGLIVNNGFLAAAGTNGPTQSLIGVQIISLSFTGELPTFVSMSVSSYFHDRVTLIATGPGGYEELKDTDGPGGPPGDTTPYRPNQYVSFASESGIQQLTLGAAWFRRYGPYLDNLYFGNVPAVPEPGAMVMLAVGVLTLAVARRRRRQA